MLDFLRLSRQSTKNILLVGQSVVYLCAFASFYWQIPGLYGETGLTPVFHMQRCKSYDILECKGAVLNLLQDFLPISSSLALSLICLIGMFLSLLTIAVYRSRVFAIYASIWFCYFSIYRSGEPFLYFQWDSLLLESGAIATIFASFYDGVVDEIGIFMYVWLAFRLMFASGVVKLQSNCPTWWGLTALNVHYESQCIPTPLGWYFHHLPQWFHRLSVALTFYIEIYLPPMFLLPIPLVRRFAAVPQFLLMALIAASGNYNFFNALYALVCVSLLYAKERKSSTFSKFLNAVGYLIIATSIVHFIVWFGITIDWERRLIDSEIIFSREEFDSVIRVVLLYSLVWGFATFAWKLLITLYKAVVYPLSNHERLLNIIHYLSVAGLGTAIFIASVAPFAFLDHGVALSLPKHVFDVHKAFDKYHFVSSYGLFRRMTGVEGRPEIILEGATTLSGPWKEIEFYAKPGNVNRMPSFVAPHQPRLDWQMWFAALGTYQQNPWFISLVHRLLSNNKNVIKHLAKFPFTKEDPMNFARADLYYYRYSKKDEKVWWTREKKREYMGVMSKDAKAMHMFLKGHKMDIPDTPEYNSQLAKVLALLLRLATQVDQVVFVWSVLATVPVIWMTKRAIL